MAFKIVFWLLVSLVIAFSKLWRSKDEREFYKEYTRLCPDGNPYRNSEKLGDEMTFEKIWHPTL